MPRLEGRLLTGRYRIEDFIGGGGMADVYKVWDTDRSCYLAIKVLRAGLAEFEDMAQRFSREAETLSRLQHPNIVRLYGLERAEDLTFIVMDYVDGPTLASKLQKVHGPLPMTEVLPIMEDVCAALTYAHKHSIYHRDIKPSNILIARDGRAILSDFGIARLSDALTMTYQGIGTPAYMSPEQCEGKEAGAASDIYSLGVVLYECVTGRRPFLGDLGRGEPPTTANIIREHVELPPPPPTEINASIRPEIEAVVMRTLAKDPLYRYQTAAELARELRVAAGGAELPSLRVSTTPGGAEVYVDGDLRGLSPLDITRLPEGAHQIRVVASGYVDYEQTINVPDYRSLELRLEPAVAAKTTIYAPLPEVAAGEGGIAPPTKRVGLFGGWWELWRKGWFRAALGLAVGGAAIATVAILFAIAGGGGEDGEVIIANPTAAPTSTPTSAPTPTEAPTVTPPSEIVYRSPSGYPVDPTTAALIVDGSVGSRRLVQGGPSVQVYSEQHQVGSDPDRANAAGWNCRTHQEFIGQPAVDWYLPKGTPVLATLDGTVTLYVNTVVNTFDYYGVPAEPYLGNPDRSRASTNPFPGPSGGKGVWAEVASDAFVARYIHLDTALTAQVVSPGAFLDRYSASFDFQSSFATPRPFTEGTPIASWEVRRGDVIGFTGDSGYAEGPQLHYDMFRVGDSDKLCPTDESGFPDNGWLRNEDPNRSTLPEQQPPAAEGAIEYAVVEGDTLRSIAEAFGVTPDDILTANGLTEEDALFIQPGDVLYIPQE